MKRVKPIVIANWKAYIETPEAAKKLTQTLGRNKKVLSGCEVWVAVPHTLLFGLTLALKKSPLLLGAQTLSPETAGAHTGSVSAGMLKASGASFVIVGHSEQRALGGINADDSGIVGQVTRAREAGLTVVLCVGERERDAAGAHFEVIAHELSVALSGFPQKSVNKLIVAYEPIWAIGKTAEEAMKADQLEEMVIFIRKTLAQVLGRTEAVKVPILYGGSVEETNARSLYQEGGVSGFLVGHASVDAASFLGILGALA